MNLKHTDDLLTALLRRPENSADTVDELNSYVSDLKAGELSDSDARYIQALANRLGVAPRSGAAPDGGGSKPDALALEAPEPDAPNRDLPPLEVVTGSFLERARTIARDTMDKYRPPDDADRQTVLDRVSEQLDGLAARLEEEILRDARGDGVLPVPTGHLRMTLMRDTETPALYMRENEKDVKTTPGYIKLAATCDELMLRLKFENGHGQGYQEHRDFDAPPLYPVEVVISGWV